MHVFHHLPDAAASLTASVVAIGNFDGVHLGHVFLLEKVLAKAKASNIPAMVLTFFPHPVEVIKPGTVLERLTTASEKLALLEFLGIDCVLVEKFDLALAQLTPEAFFLRYLRDGLKAKSIHVGHDFRFGSQRSGTTDQLKALAAKEGIAVEVALPLESEGDRISSSLIRSLLAQGETLRAANLLGRPYSIGGLVTLGDQRGRLLGFPTANIQYPEEKVLPANGVYVTRTYWQKQVFRSITNIGVRPTFGGMTRKIEVHVLDLDAKLYDEFLRIEFLEPVRPEMKFDSVDRLKAQIALDVEVARNAVSLKGI